MQKVLRDVATFVVGCTRFSIRLGPTYYASMATLPILAVLNLTYGGPVFMGLTVVVGCILYGFMTGFTRGSTMTRDDFTKIVDDSLAELAELRAKIAASSENKD